jgi:hypothetical protein
VQDQVITRYISKNAMHTTGLSAFEIGDLSHEIYRGARCVVRLCNKGLGSACIRARRLGRGKAPMR